MARAAGPRVGAVMLRIWLKTLLVETGIRGWLPRRLVDFLVSSLELRHV